jgi:hypothetical protein
MPQKYANRKEKEDGYGKNDRSESEGQKGRD